jgi:predicted nucleic acid-binding protein
MVAVDTSTFIAYLQGAKGRDIDLLTTALGTSDAVLPAVVLVELLSDAGLPNPHRAAILEIPLLDTHADYWLRAAEARATVLAHKLRARLPDTLIAQSCIDNDVPLITRDGDFRHFAKHCGLKLA